MKTACSALFEGSGWSLATVLKKCTQEKLNMSD